MVVYHLQNVSGNLVEKWWNTTFWVVPAENSREQQNISKGCRIFPDGMFQREIRVPVDSSFRPSWPFFSKWNWFVQMVNAIPGRNLPVLDCLPFTQTCKPWTDRFAHVKGKQPILTQFIWPEKKKLLKKISKKLPTECLYGTSTHCDYRKPRCKLSFFHCGVIWFTAICKALWKCLSEDEWLEVPCSSPIKC